MTYINTRGWLRRMGARIGGQVGLTGGGGKWKGWGPPTLYVKKRPVLLVYRAVHDLCPVYLSSLVTPYISIRTLRSTDQDILTIPRYGLERYGRRAFSVAGPTPWNALPPAVRQANSVAVFKSFLKTHLFREGLWTLCWHFNDWNILFI